MDRKDKLKFIIENMVRKELKEQNLFEEESDFDIDDGGAMAKFIKDMANELEDEVEEKQVDEAVGAVSIISYILLSARIATLLSKFIKFLGKKFDIKTKTGSAAARYLYEYGHGIESKAINLIKKFIIPILPVGKNRSDADKDKIAHTLYGIIIFSLALDAGGDAFDALAKSKWGKTLLYTVKTAIKGEEAVGIFSKIQSAIE